MLAQGTHTYWGPRNAGMRCDEHSVGTLKQTPEGAMLGSHLRASRVHGAAASASPRLPPRLVARPLHVAEDELVLVDGDLARAELREQQQRARGGETWEEVGR